MSATGLHLHKCVARFVSIATAEFLVCLFTRLFVCTDKNQHFSIHGRPYAKARNYFEHIAGGGDTLFGA